MVGVSLSRSGIATRIQGVVFSCCKTSPVVARKAARAGVSHLRVCQTMRVMTLNLCAQSRAGTWLDLSSSSTATAGQHGCSHAGSHAPFACFDGLEFHSFNEPDESSVTLRNVFDYHSRASQDCIYVWQRRNLRDNASNVRRVTRMNAIQFRGRQPKRSRL